MLGQWHKSPKSHFNPRKPKVHCYAAHFATFLWTNKAFNKKLHYIKSQHNNPEVRRQSRHLESTGHPELHFGSIPNLSPSVLYIHSQVTPVADWWTRPLSSPSHRIWSRKKEEKMEEGEGRVWWCTSSIPAQRKQKQADLCWVPDLPGIHSETLSPKHPHPKKKIVQR